MQKNREALSSLRVADNHTIGILFLGSVTLKAMLLPGGWSKRVFLKFPYIELNGNSFYV
jgi:hypothetical protein